MIKKYVDWADLSFVMEPADLMENIIKRASATRREKTPVIPEPMQAPSSKLLDLCYVRPTVTANVQRPIPVADEFLSEVRTVGVHPIMAFTPPTKPASPLLLRYGDVPFRTDYYSTINVLDLVVDMEKYPHKCPRC